MPDWKVEIARRLSALNLVPAREAEIAEELSQHLDDRYNEMVAGGSTEDEARRETLKELSDENLLASGLQRVEQEVPREPVVPRSRNGRIFLPSLWQDLRYGLRQLRRNPGFTAVAVVTLALGIGANTAIFSIINATLLRPLPFRNPSRLVQLWETEASPGQYPLAGPDYLDWQEQNHTLQASSLYTWPQSFGASGAGEPEEAAVVATQANFFSVLGVQPLLGRSFLRGENRAGFDHVAVLGYGFWQRHFGGRMDALGKTVELNLQKYTVVGVMPAWFDSAGVGPADVWVPLDMARSALHRRGSHYYLAIGRLRPGVSVAQARADLVTIAKRLGAAHPDSDHEVGAAIIPLNKQLLGDSRTELLIMMGVVGLVLLIACVNVANLLLARAAGRRGEFAVRQALGSTRRRIIRQLLTESVLLWLIGGGLGLAFGWAGLRGLSLATTALFPHPNPFALDGTVLLFTLGISAVAGLLFGLAPAWQLSCVKLSDELKAGNQSVVSPAGNRRRLGEALVVVEIALSLALLTGAGLLLRSFVRLRETPVGIRATGALTAKIALPPKKYASPRQIGSFYQQLLAQLTGAPGITEAAVSSEIPLKGGNDGYITVPGRPDDTFGKVLVEWNYITPGYFQVMGIPFFKGRNFTAQDSQDTASGMAKVDAMVASGKMHPVPGVEFTAIVNATMAKTFWPGKDALGQIFVLGGLVPTRVIGVVGDVKVFGLWSTAIPEAYFPDTAAFDNAGMPMFISLKTTGAAGTGLASLRNRVHALDPNLALFHVRTMGDIISQETGDTRYQVLLLGLFALLALALTVVGIYGVMSYAVRQRTHEIAMRMALGASPRNILELLTGRAAVIALIGVGTGIAAAFGLTRFLTSLLYGVKPTDPLTFVAVSITLVAVALLASYIPARRATKVDPIAL